MMAMIHALSSNHSVVIGVALHYEITTRAKAGAHGQSSFRLGRLFEGEACALAASSRYCRDSCCGF
jgi:hypothetical protein